MPKRGKKHTHKKRRHTNTDGRAGIKSGSYRRQMRELARKLGVPFGQRLGSR